MAELGNYLAQNERQRRIAAASDSILARAGLIPHDPGNEYTNMTATNIAAEAAERAGVDITGHSQMEIIASGFTASTSDFPTILQNTLRKAVLRGYDEAAEDLRWCSTGALPDFRTQKRLGVGPFPELLEVPELASFTQATFGEKGESISLATFGRTFALSRQAVLNDDLNVLVTTPRRAGRAASRLVADLAYRVLTENANMADGVALFHADHANLLAGAGLTAANVSAMAAAMGAQQQNGQLLNLRLKYLIVPIALEATAQIIAAATIQLFDGGLDPTSPNPWFNRGLQVVSDPRLDAVSATAWFGAADPTRHDVVELAYLNGNDQPTVEFAKRLSQDGTLAKVRIDVGARALDFRTLAKNPGA